jgi:hypothetical protein
LNHQNGWYFVDDVIQKAYIGIGGPENYPHFKTVNGTFNIDKLSLVF